MSSVTVLLSTLRAMVWPDTPIALVFSLGYPFVGGKVIADLSVWQLDAWARITVAKLTESSLHSITKNGRHSLPPLLHQTPPDPFAELRAISPRETTAASLLISRLF